MDTPNLPPKVRERLEGLGYVLSFTGVVCLLAHSLTDWGLPFWPMYIIIGIFLCGIMVKVFFAFRQGLTKYAVVYGLICLAMLALIIFLSWMDRQLGIA